MPCPPIHSQVRIASCRKSSRVVDSPAEIFAKHMFLLLRNILFTLHSPASTPCQPQNCRYCSIVLHIGQRSHWSSRQIPHFFHSKKSNKIHCSYPCLHEEHAVVHREQRERGRYRQ